MNKKKILSLALVIALLAIMVGSSLAYFTAQDEVTNVFTVGSVKVEIYENGEATEDVEKNFGPLVPVVNMENPSEDVNYQDKLVEVKNTGLNAAYIRTHIAIPSALVNYLKLDLNTTNGWNYQGASYVEVDEMVYTVYTYDYYEALASGETTIELLKGAYLASDVDLLENEDENLEFIRRNLSTGEVSHKSGFVAHKKVEGGYSSNKVNILVATQAIQAEGFDSTVPNAAANALNAGFAGTPWPVAEP